MARERTFYLPVMVATAVLVACAVVLLAVSEEAEAAFPGKNGRIAYNGDNAIYTIDPTGRGKTRVTGGYLPSYSSDGERIAYALYTNDDRQSDIYTIDASGGGRTRVTNTDNAFVEGPSWGSRP